MIHALETHKGNGLKRFAGCQHEMLRETPMSMSTVESLRAARALIEDPARWTQGTWARNEIGVPVLARATGAVKWCALGAMHRQDSSFAAIECLGMAARILYYSNPELVNDDLGHAAVMQMYDKAIEIAEAEQ